MDLISHYRIMKKMETENKFTNYKKNKQNILNSLNNKIMG